MRLINSYPSFFLHALQIYTRCRGQSSASKQSVKRVFLEDNVVGRAQSFIEHIDSLLRKGSADKLADYLLRIIRIQLFVDAQQGKNITHANIIEMKSLNGGILQCCDAP